MKKYLVFTIIMIFGILFYFQVSNWYEYRKTEIEELKIDLINDEFPEAKAEIMTLLEELKQTFEDRNIEKLIAGQGYGPKFTEFRNGDRRNDGKENEAYNRELFSNITEVVKFDYDNLKVSVFDKVANVTFHSDIHFKFGEEDIIAKNQTTLLYVKTENGWKCVHEHHSPLAKKEE